MPDNTSYSTDSSRAIGYTYDPSSGTWVPVSPTIGTPPSASTQEPESVPTSATGNTSSGVDSKSKSDKKYIEIELNTLVGELVVSPSEKNIRIKINDTVEVLGVGSHLSGKYFVSSVKRTLNKDSGYSQTLTVIKNGFGDSLKKKTNSSSGSISSSTPDSTSDRVKAVEKTAPQIKIGDTVKIVGNAIYTNGEPVPAWVKQKNLTVNQISSDGTRVLLTPIYSWTYIRYVQKA